MRYFATQHTITTTDKSNDPDWIEITEQQYRAGIDAIMDGREIVVEGGSFIIRDPEPSDQEPEQEQEEPGLAPVPEEISRRQFYQGLALAGFITKSEALTAMDGAIPAPLEVIVDELPTEDDQFAAAMLLKGASTFQRWHPLVSTFASFKELSEEEVDDFWRMCAEL